MSSPFPKEPAPSLRREGVIEYLVEVQKRGFSVREMDDGGFVVDVAPGQRVGLHPGNGPSDATWFTSDGPGTRRYVKPLYNLDDLRARLDPLLGMPPQPRANPSPSSIETLGDYEFDRTIDANHLGSGGFADVYRATHLPTGEQRALKVARRDPDSRARMKREIEVQRPLVSPYIVPILDAGEDSSWFTMPIADESLGDFFDRQPQASHEEIAAFVREISGGLRVASDRDLVHRDLSPTNILRLKGKWAIADWGFVRRPPGETTRRLTVSGVGTAPWAAPETWTEGHNVDRRADIFSLGRLVGWLVSRRVPIPIQDTPIDFRSRWFPFVRKLTALSPNDRPQWIGEVIDLLGTVPDHDAADPTEHATRDVEFSMHWTIARTSDQFTFDVRYIPRYQDPDTAAAMRGGGYATIPAGP